MSFEAIEELIAQRVVDALATYKSNQNTRNGNKNGSGSQYDGRSGSRRIVHTARGCTYKEFLNCQTLNFNGTEGAGLPDSIQGNVNSTRTTRLQDTVKLANSLMDQKIHVFAARQADNKRRMDNNPRNVHVQQPPYKRVGHQTKDCRSLSAATNQRASVANQRTMATCYECGEQGHYKSNYPKLKNQNRENQTENGLFSPPKIDLSYSGLEEFKQPEFESYGPKFCEIESKNASKNIPNELKESPDAPLVKDRASNNKDCSVKSPVVVEKKSVVPTIAKVEIVRPKQQVKPSRKPVKPVNIAHPKTIVYSARPMSHFSNLAPSTVRRPIQKKTALTNRSFHQKVNTAKGIVNTARQSINTARPSPALVNADRENQGHPQQVQEDQGYADSGCSRHMTANMSYLLDFKEFSRGYVTFGGGANGGRITG
nr:reverse transcriptase domain-containing protein [Tanacetum cinerariifolium]